MTRIAALVVLIAIVAPGVAVSGTARNDAPVLSTPVGDPIERAGTVPISLMIQNEGDNDDLLVGGKTPAAVRVEVHRTRLIDGRGVMEVAAGIAIPAGKTLVLEPGSSHLMLVGLRFDLVQGATFPLTLSFERAGEVTVTVRVRRRVDAAGVTPIPPVVAGHLSVSLASAPPAPAETSVSLPNP